MNPSTTIAVAALTSIVACPMASAAGEAAKWEVVARCAAPGSVGPGEGLFEVRYQTAGMDAIAIDLRGCGERRMFHKRLKWGGDAVPIHVYAVPFFSKGRFDILIEEGWDDGATYSLYTAASNYEKSAVELTAVSAPFFGDTNQDGRWEMYFENIEEIRCGNGKPWKPPGLSGSGGATLDPDTLCRS